MVSTVGVDDTTKIGEVSVPMQNVCDHHISKILKFPEVAEKIQQLNESGRQYKLVMYGKYGADGTTTDAEYQTADAGEFSFLKKYQYLEDLQCNNCFPYKTNLYWPPDSFGCWNFSLTAGDFKIFEM